MAMKTNLQLLQTICGVYICTVLYLLGKVYQEYYHNSLGILGMTYFVFLSLK